MLNAIEIQIRSVQGTLGPRLGSKRVSESTTETVPTVEGGHFDEYPCSRCGARLLTRAARSAVRAHGIVCTTCPASGLIASRAEDTLIPGLLVGPDWACNGCSEVVGQVPENGPPKSLKSLRQTHGFSGTTTRGGRPRLSPEERKRRARDRKRRQRGISEPARVEE